jgi:two-component system chemotaxis response regulator CheB
LKSARPIRVLIVDDSPLVRRILEESLRREPDIDVIATAPDPYVARDKILTLSPDVVTLDVEMPRMDGLSFLKRLMRHHPLPVILISSLGQAGSETALEALRWGAVDVLAKPNGSNSACFADGQLAAKIRAAAMAKMPSPAEEITAGTLPARTLPASEAKIYPQKTGNSETLFGHAGNRRKLLVIGSSTGGPPALETLLSKFGADCPPILIAQHIPAGFSKSLAARFDRQFPMQVREATNGDLIEPGKVLIAPGNFHMVLQAEANANANSGMGGGGSGVWRVRIMDGPLVRYQRPSVDVLFHSVARVAGRDAVAAILTGMGNDGAEGLLAIRQAGGWTLAQDEASSTVYGMPREAVSIGAVCEEVSLQKMAARMDAALKRTQRQEIAASAEPGYSDLLR